MRRVRATAEQFLRTEAAETLELGLILTWHVGCEDKVTLQRGGVTTCSRGLHTTKTVA